MVTKYKIEQRDYNHCNTLLSKKMNSNDAYTLVYTSGLPVNTVIYILLCKILL